MKLKELKQLIEGCHVEDLNNELEAIVISKENKIFKTDSIRVDTDSGRIIIATQDSEQFKLNKLNADKEMEFAKKMLSIKSVETEKGLNLYSAYLFNSSLAIVLKCTSSGPSPILRYLIELYKLASGVS